MKWCTGLLMIVVITAGGARAAAQQLTESEQQELRARIERRYDVVPLTGGVALRPKTPDGEVRLIEVSDTIAINGVAVSGRELRERVGADADAILRLSYLDANARRALFEAVEARTPVERELGVERPTPSTPDVESRRARHSRGDRVRVFGNVTVPADEEVAGQVVAVLGSVRVDGEVRQQVVSVLGSVDLGPRAVVHGDVVAVGGRVHKAAGAQIGGAVTEVSLGDAGAHVNVSPWFDGWGPFHFSGFGPVTRLVGSTFRVALLAFLACVALVLARRPVEGSAQRITDNPVQATLVGLAAWVLFAPVLFLTAVVLAISIIGIPLLLLIPFAVLVVLLMALVGFTGAAYAVGQWTRRRIGMGAVPAFVDVCVGVIVILLPLLVGRILALVGWPLSPVVFLLLATGLAVEFVAWSTGLGAVLTNAFTRWRATRATRVTTPAV